MSNSKPGPRRVESWIYGVLNPLEEAMERAALSGLRCDPGYRRRTRSLEGLVVFREYLTRAGGILLDDLLRSHPEVVSLAKRYDQVVERVYMKSKDVFDRLVANGDYTAFVAARFAKVCAPETLLDEVTEDLVNDQPELIDAAPGSYREAWNVNLGRLKQFRDASGYGELHASLTALNTLAEEVRAELQRLRNELVDEYDVPAAPLHA